MADNKGSRVFVFLFWVAVVIGFLISAAAICNGGYAG